VTRGLLAASPAPLAFAALTVALAATGELDTATAVRAGVAALTVLVVTVLGGASGWRGRVGAMLLFPAGLALFLVTDAQRRALLLWVVLAAAALAAGAVSLTVARGWRRKGCAAALALALLVVTPPPEGPSLGWRLAVAATAVAAAAAAARRPETGMLVAALAPAVALAAPPPMAVGALLLAAALPFLPAAEQVASRLLPLAAAASLAGAAFGAWGMRLPSPLFPEASPLLPGVAALAIVAVPRVPVALAAALWLAATVWLGPIQPAVSGQPVVLTAASPRAELTAGGELATLVEISLAHASELPDGTPVALLHAGGASIPLQAGRDAAEWAHRRADVRRVVRHGLPRQPVWRPQRAGDEGLWAVAGRLRLPAAAPFPLVAERVPTLPERVQVTVLATPMRRSPLLPLLFGAALVVAFLQLASGAWASGTAAVPWVVLTGASILARVAVPPVAGAIHHHAADLALAAVVVAWLPAARRWLRQQRDTLAAAALLVPLAVATPVLTPPLYGDEPYHLAILDALRRGASLPQAVTAGAPPGHAPLHGPFLAVLLLPGYSLAGRTGALVELALLAAVAVGVAACRARALGAPPRRVGMVVALAVGTAPLGSYATQIWPEAAGMLAVATCLVLASRGPVARLMTSGVALMAAAVKTRLALFTFPVAAAGLWLGKRRRRQGVVALAVLATAALAALGVARLFLGHALGAPRTLGSLLAVEPRRALLAAGGLLFDPAGGLAVAASLSLVAALGLPRLVREGGPGERGAVMGCTLTVLALLHSVEWYGGGAPPARYLAAGLPVLWLAGALLLRRPPPAIAAVPALLPLAVTCWWALLARPHFSINPGNGRFWLAELVAERFAADTRHLTPSFLVPSVATAVFPLVAVTVAGAVWLLGRWHPSWVRWLGQQGVALWLAAMAVTALHLAWRTDRWVELEDPQVRHRGGRVEPPPGTWSTYLHRRGWRLADGDELLVPLRLPEGCRVSLVGWLEGAARQGSSLEVRWDEGRWARVTLVGEGVGRVALPPPAAGGRRTLALRFHAPSGGEAVADRLEVER